MRSGSVLRAIFVFLFGVFCCAYPIAITGVAFDVRPPFSLAWAASALLFLEGSLLIAAAMLVYGQGKGLLAGLLVVVLSFIVETVGVNTGLPFGHYHYTPVLFPRLPGGVPLAVMAAWVLIVLGVYGWVQQSRLRMSFPFALLGALLATLLDLEIEPVAAYLEHYWEWSPLGRDQAGFYGVPLTNFAAWFAVAFVLLVIVDAVLLRTTTAPWLVGTRFIPSLNRHLWRIRPSTKLHTSWRILIATLPILTPRFLFVTSLFMFGLVDLTHGYYLAVLMGLGAGLLLYCLRYFKSVT